MQLKHYGIAALVLATGASALVLKTTAYGSIQDASDKPVQKALTPTFSVSVAAAKRTSLRKTFESYGDLVSFAAVDVAPQISGQISRVLVADGAIVKKDQPIIELDATVADAELGAAKAELEAAKKTLDRAAKLAKSATIARVSLEKATLSHVIAQTKYDLKKAQRALYTIRAPFAGVLTKIAGVRGTTVRPGMALTRLEDQTRLRVRFRIPERLWSQVKSNQRIWVKSHDRWRKEIEGKILYVAPEADPKSRSLLVEGVIENAKRTLVAGLFVQLRVETGIRFNIVTIPQTSLIEKLSGSYVFTVKDNKVQRRKVSVGEKNDGRVEITNGLDVGAIVVIKGQSQLTDNAQIRIAQKG